LVFHFATSANLSPKSTHVFYSHPLAINLVLSRSTFPFILGFFLLIHFHIMAYLSSDKEKRYQVFIFCMLAISSCMANL
jgi:hypothetical protein